MRILQFTFLFILAFFGRTIIFGQSLTKIKSLLLNADSVILTSHVSPPELIKKNENPNDWKPVLNKKINPRFIKKQKLINDSSIKYLSFFITKSFRDKIILEGRCFIPHHTIYIYNGSNISYINICFLCEEIKCSKDIKFPMNDFDEATWKKLKRFFKTQGFKYGFSSDDP